MMLLTLLVLLICICSVAFILSGRDVVSPAFLFSAGFALATLCACLFSEQWGFTLHLRAFLVILLGVALFVGVSATVHYYFGKQGVRSVTETNSHIQEVENGAYGDGGNLIVQTLFFIIQIVITILTIVKINSFFQEASPFSAIGMFKESKTFSSDNLSFGFPLNQIVNLIRASGYYFAYLLAKQLVTLRKTNRVSLAITLLNFVSTLVLGFIVGGRTLGLGYVFCALASYLLLRRRRGLGIPLVLPIGVAAGVIVFLLLFRFLSFGRSGNLGLSEYIGIYLGAPIYNLDAYLEAGTFGSSTPFGRMTLYCWYSYIGLKMGYAPWIYTLDLPFVTSGTGMNMGNVYTTFYAYIYDFGYIGVVVLIVVMAVLSQLAYEWALRCDSRNLWDLAVIAYSFIGYQLMFSFFSNKFYEEILTPGYITTAIYLLVARYILAYLPKHIKRIKASLSTAKASS